MPLKPSNNRWLVLAGIAVFAISAVLFTVETLGKAPQPPADRTPPESTQGAPIPEQPAVGLPVRLKIPSLKIDTAVEHVGLTPQGAMDVPSSPTTVAWYRLGPRPGAIGSAAIDGHFGWKNGRPSVFDALHTIQPGDVLSVVDDQGVETGFVVRELRSYGQAEYVPSVFVSTDGLAHLNLITCQGIWNEAKQSYPDRLVVFTDKRVI